ncbi:SWIM zinc finger family protein [Streptomyces sp. 549]|uniref:SWIM zinc finger family protein n=1 Tax=Streptomyces sp. 549 TaxID=3049076 RepID=UPI0024C2D479|nr:SWIM zinc finger family protein [Streptomyces sp. 549]MDK1472608.1 SWIM zinc finger family protein [Streptomyces sp. 549]
MTRTTQVYSYLRPSAVQQAPAGPLLGLETSGGLTPAGAEANPRFFHGFLTEPQAASQALLAVADIAAARYHRRLAAASLDPVVTANGDRLRFESFSGCCGVYARLDVLPRGLDGDDIRHGTTNVDVNSPLRESLSRVGSGDPLHLRVGPEEMAVTTLTGPVVEKKVPLPDRWLRGFAETQVIASGFDLRAELGAVQAQRYLRSLPRGATASGGVGWVVPAAGTLRPTTRPVPGAVCLPGPARLGVLHRVLRHVTGLRVYGPPVAAGGAAFGSGADGGPVASAWEVSLPGMRLTLMLSPQAARGFSGEGAVLEHLATGTAVEAEEAATDAELTAALLAWDPRIDPADLADRSGLPRDRVRAALTRLGTAGRVGYDTAEAAYFHRELPYDADRVERHNPRLRSARALLEAGAVTLDGDLATVRSEDRVHHVRREADGRRTHCTCPWWAEHRGGRGPCKHVLAVGLAHRADLHTDRSVAR